MSNERIFVEGTYYNTYYKYNFGTINDFNEKVTRMPKKEAFPYAIITCSRLHNIGIGRTNFDYFYSFQKINV